MPEDKKKHIVTNRKNLANEAQTIVYNKLVKDLEKARYVALQEQFEREYTNAQNLKENEYNKAFKEWTDRTTNKESITAQTLPATLLSDLVLLSNLWGTIVRRNLDKEFTAPAEIRKFISAGLDSLSFKVKNALVRNLGEGDTLALPELSYYVSLDDKGKLNPNPVFSKPTSDDEIRMNKLVNQACDQWLKEVHHYRKLDDGGYKKYETYTDNQGNTKNRFVKLEKNDFDKLVKDTDKGLDKYLLDSCKVHFIMKEPSEPTSENQTPRR